MDIRELRINSSVLYDGERVKVCSIADINPFEPGVIVKSSKQKSLWKAMSESLSPIPITEELLKELMPPKGLYESLGDWHVFVLTHGEFQIEVKIVGERTCVSIRMYDEYSTKFAEMIGIRYLHELENFVYMTTKKELI